MVKREQQFPFRLITMVNLASSINLTLPARVKSKHSENIFIHKSRLQIFPLLLGASYLEQV